MPLLKALGSLYFAITLIASFAILLICSTIYESIHGTQLAQAVFYRTGWFDAFLFLLWLNIFSSAALRFPFKKRHTGFVITHIGILTLLFGSMLARQFGVEGQMQLAEGEKTAQIRQEGKRLAVMFPAHKALSFELERAGHRQAYERRVKGADFALKVHRTVEKAVRDLTVAEGAAETAPNRALRVTLRSDRAGLNDAFWLIEQDPENPHARVLPLGPAILELITPDTDLEPKSPALEIQRDGKTFTFELSPNPPAEIAAPDLGITIRNLRFFRHAKVEGNAIVESPDDTPPNPAATFEAAGPDGAAEKHTKFAIFPEYSSIHGGEKADKLGLSVRLNIPFESMHAEAGTAARLTFRRGADGWSYESISSRGSDKREGKVETGKEIETGWMDMRFVVESVFDRALVERRVREAASGENGETAVEASLVIAGKETPRQWITESRSGVFDTASGEFEAGILPAMREVPFIVELKDFRKTDYPGTAKPASFESDVSITDPKRKLRLEKTISMNEPLDFAGYRIFQSSYFQESFGEGSVFTVAKNPGIPLIYGGAIVLFTGVIVLFYIPALSSFSKKEGEAIENRA